MTSKPHLSVVRTSSPTLKKDLTTAAGRVAHYEAKLLERGLAPKTVVFYCRYIHRLEWWCEQQGCSARNVPGLVLTQYVEFLIPKSNAARNVLRAALKHYWEIFKRKDPPLWAVRVPRAPRKVCRALTDEEATALAALAGARRDRPGFAVQLAMYQGLRREEISKVRWRDFDEEGWLYVMGKGDLPAKIPVHPVVRETLAQLERSHPVWVFPSQRRRGSQPVRPVSPSTIWDWVRRLAAEAGGGVHPLV